MRTLNCAPSSARSAAVSAASRVSCHAISGATARPSSASNTPDSAMLATPTPRIRPGGAAATASESAARAASTRASPSVWVPSAVVVHGVGARPAATSRPSGATTTALQEVVPTSSPTSHGRICPPLDFPGC